MTTESVIAHHLEAFMSGDVDEIMSDYAEDAVVFHPEGTAKGTTEIRSLIESLLTLLAPLIPNFEMVRQDSHGDVMYLAWKSGDAAPLGTDTFVVQNDKIVAQTVTAYIA